MVGIELTDVVRYCIYAIVYMFSCRLALELLNYLATVKANCFQGSEKLRKQFYSQYKTLVRTPSEKYKERNKDLDPERSNYTSWLYVSVILIIFNSFVLAEFLNNIGNLSKLILIDPIQIRYSHLIAMVIVLVEVFTGAGYYLAHDYQEKTEQPIWATLKFAAVLTFIFLATVETIMWMNLSVNFEMSDALNLSTNNVFRNFVDYFLAFLGIAFTIFEFLSGYFTSKFRQNAGESTILNNGRFIINTIGLILFLFVPNLILLVLGALINPLFEIIKVVIMPGNFIYASILPNKANNI